MRNPLRFQALRSVSDAKETLEHLRGELDYRYSFCVREEFWSFETGMQERGFAIHVFHQKIHGEEIAAFRASTLEQVWAHLCDWFDHWQLMRTAN